MRIIGIVTLACGLLALAFGGFTTTRQTRDISLGNVEIAVNERQRVNVPIWAGVVLVVVGAGLLVTNKK